MCIRVSKQANQLRDSVPLNTGLRPSSTRAGGNRETLFLPTTGRPLFDGEGNKKKKLSQESLFLTSLVPQTSFKNILSAMHFFLQRSTLWSSRNILQWISKRIVTSCRFQVYESKILALTRGPRFELDLIRVSDNLLAKSSRSSGYNTWTSFIRGWAAGDGRESQKLAGENRSGENLRSGIKISFYCATRGARGNNVAESRRNDGAIMEGKYGRTFVTKVIRSYRPPLPISLASRL